MRQKEQDFSIRGSSTFLREKVRLILNAQFYVEYASRWREEEIQMNS